MNCGYRIISGMMIVNSILEFSEYNINSLYKLGEFNLLVILNEN